MSSFAPSGESVSNFLMSIVDLPGYMLRVGMQLIL
jgi:hypothetical protein